ncbi:MAG: hypothetical protein V1758_12220 [Pseudomonadota bacterium]
MSGKALEGGLTRGGMFSLVVDILEPQIQGLIEFRKGFASEAGKKLPPDGAEEPLM